MARGPQFGYFPEPKKSFLVVHDTFINRAEQVFIDCGIQVVSSRRFLGGIIGDSDDEMRYIDGKVDEWINELKVLAMIGEKQPQVAYSALVKSLQSKWNFVQRVIQGGQMSYHRLEKFLADVLLPAFFGTEVTNEERDLFSLPSRLGGLGVFNPEKKSGQSYVYSRRSCQSIIGAIKGLVQFEIQSHLSTIAGVKSDYKKSIELNYEEDFNTVIVRFDKNRQRAINRSKDGRLSGWLTVLPIAKFHFDLSPQEFRDALALRYKKPLLRVPGFMLEETLLIDSQFDIDLI